jgi:CHASE3 domain sensor protein
VSTSNLRGVVKRTLALPVLLLLAFAAALSIWIAHLMRSQAMVEHSYDVLSEISDTQKLLLDQETGLRAYMLTTDEAFLQPFVEGKLRFSDSLASLRRETQNDPLQSQRVHTLDRRYRMWLQYAEEEKQITGASDGGAPRDAATHARMIARKQQMDRLRADFTLLYDEERRLLRERLDTANRANVMLLSAGALLVLVCASLLFIFLRVQLRLIDQIHQTKIDESERERSAAEALAAEVQEQSAELEAALLAANRERDDAVRALQERGPR